MALIFHGAEAVVEDDTYLGRAIVAKRRIPKAYRHPELDARLRDERTRDEGNLLLAARRAGVAAPLVYDIDRHAAVLRLEKISGEALRDVLEKDDDATAAARFVALGRQVARLHDAGLTHGDLTTSNILVPVPPRPFPPADPNPLTDPLEADPPADPLDATDPARLVLIDFGLGSFTQEHEEKAVDLHLLEEALEATDARATALMDAFLASYLEASIHGAATMRRLEGVRERGRYRGAA